MMDLCGVLRQAQDKFHQGFAACIAVCAFWGVCCPAYAQNITAPLNSPTSVLINRALIQDPDISPLHTAIQPYRRGDVFFIAGAVSDTARRILSVFDRAYLLADNDEFYFAPAHMAQISLPGRLAAPQKSKRPFLGVFYTRPAHFYAHDDSAFYLRIDPILDFSLGKEPGQKDLLFVNRRGIEIRGGIDQKVFFSSNIIEAQLRPPSYVQRYIETYRALPDAGLFKDFNGHFFGGNGAYDYLTSNGYVGFNVTKHIGVQLGHGKNFIGDGYRSLFLSDFAKNYFYLKLNTRVWKFHYQNIFAELGATEKLPGNTLVPKKYLAAHYLSFNARPNLNFGLFEAVIFAREKNRFELQYLNPVILYRSIEHHVGSPDNVLIGLSAHWDVFHQIRFYSQLLLDELKFSEVFSSRHWWGNKQGIQLGAFYVNALGVRDLDVRLEYNKVRPFTYSHYDSLGSYATFNQPLAHPLGANFNELLLKLDYRPVPRLWLCGKAFMIRAGEDTADIDYGADILRPNTERNAEFGVLQRQGIPVQNMILSLDASYMIRHNLFLEAQYFYRNSQSDAPGNDLLTRYISIGVRWNYFPSQNEY